MFTYPEPIRYCIHLRSPAERVYRLIASDEGRARFWANTRRRGDGRIDFVFSDGTRLESREIGAQIPALYELTYFNNSRVRFELQRDTAGGTDLCLTERDLPPENYPFHVPGWIPVLLALKAAADFGIDLRNQDPARNWRSGYVDV